MFYTLLLNSGYQCISFITEKRAFKLISKADKVETEEYWDAKIKHGRDGLIRHPAVLRLKHQVRWIPRKMRFNRIGVFKRDQYCCQYCGLALTPSQLTLEHIVPQDRGGPSTWLNCVTACFLCNNKKSNRTPEEAGMRLLNKPRVPMLSIVSEYKLIKHKHPSWKNYIPDSE